MVLSNVNIDVWRCPCILSSRCVVAPSVCTPDEEDAVVISTAVTVTALATASLGACLVLIGKLKLARFVSYLPVPVIGG